MVNSYEIALKWLSEGKMVLKKYKYGDYISILKKIGEFDHHICYRHPYFYYDYNEGVNKKEMKWRRVALESLLDFQREFTYRIVKEEELPELDKELTRLSGFVV